MCAPVECARPSPLGNLARSRRGAAAIEFALLLTPFLMVTFGIIELGIYGMEQQALLESVHAGVRYAVVHGSKSSSPATTASLQTMVQNASSVLTPSLVSVTVTFSPNNSPGSTVKIVATYPWSSVVPLLKLSSGTVTATSVSTILN
jgi:Flp pilus assembly protein TadG